MKNLKLQLNFGHHLGKEKIKFSGLNITLKTWMKTEG
jgi:hypothetical protein